MDVSGLMIDPDSGRVKPGTLPGGKNPSWLMLRRCSALKRGKG